MRTGAIRRGGAALLLALALAGCGAAPGPPAEETGPVMALPGDRPLPEGLGPEQLLYVTDRNRSEGARGPDYGHLRNASMALGVAGIRLAEAPAAGLPARLPHAVTGTAERVRFPRTPLPFSQSGGVIRPDPGPQADYDRAGAAFRAEIGAALRRAGQSEIVMFVHGYNSDFDEALATTAHIWQATGRTGLPLAYTWPAANPGLFGYFKDRESGEFSIFHLKQVLRLLTQVEGLERLHVVAHSRGTDVTTTALREMIIAERAAGRNPRRTLRVENLIMAAPDLDFGVVRQRLIAERFGPAFGRITVYMNPDDSALGLAQTLMSGQRFGRLSFEELGPVEREIFRQIGNVHFINVGAVVAGRSSHGYFSRNPDVLRDMAQVITTGAPPGAAGRNLIPEEANFWQLLTPAAFAARAAPREPAR